LESIPGWRAALPPAEMLAVLRETGCVICAAGPGLAPADRRVYGPRDGTGAVVVDVKGGSGAFMRDVADARLLAQTMVTLGDEHGVRTSALLTSMDTPLGRCVGNALEVEEAVATLAGDGPPDLVEVVLALAAEMLRLAGIDADPVATLADGRALAT